MMEHGKDIIEILTDVYNTLYSNSNTEAAEYATDHDQTAVHSGSSLTEDITVVKPPITNYSWLFCALHTGLTSKVCQSSWNLTSQTSLPLDFLTRLPHFLSLTRTSRLGLLPLTSTLLPLSFPLVSGWYNILSGQVQGAAQAQGQATGAHPSSH